MCGEIQVFQDCRTYYCQSLKSPSTIFIFMADKKFGWIYLNKE